MYASVRTALKITFSWNTIYQFWNSYTLYPLACREEVRQFQNWWIMKLFHPLNQGNVSFKKTLYSSCANTFYTSKWGRAGKVAGCQVSCWLFILVKTSSAWVWPGCTSGRDRHRAIVEAVEAGEATAIRPSNAGTNVTDWATGVI